MARRKKPQKRTWFRMLLLFLLVPLTVWLGAFLLWFYWYDLDAFFAPSDGPRVPTKAVRQSESESPQRAPQPQKSQERILDEDRKKLEEILKRRSESSLLWKPGTADRGRVNG